MIVQLHRFIDLRHYSLHARYVLGLAAGDAGQRGVGALRHRHVATGQALVNVGGHADRHTANLDT